MGSSWSCNFFCKYSIPLRAVGWTIVVKAKRKSLGWNCKRRVTNICASWETEIKTSCQPAISQPAIRSQWQQLLTSRKCRTQQTINKKPLTITSTRTTWTLISNSEHTAPFRVRFRVQRFSLMTLQEVERTIWRSLICSIDLESSYHHSCFSTLWCKYFPQFQWLPWQLQYYQDIRKSYVHLSITWE